MVKRIAAMALVVAVALVAGRPAAAGPLKVGDKAPELAVGKWAQGEPVKSFEADHVYIVEFWATWCGPCRATIPHVNDLAKKYKDKVTVVGVSVWEDDPAGVEPFIKEMGDKMTYRVALDSVPEGGDPNEGKMAKNWMAAAGQDGIPAAFIVDGKGTVAWIGHPSEMDGPLEQIVAGKYDVAAAAKEQAKAGEMKAKFQELVKELQAKTQAGDVKGAIAVMDQIMEAVPDAKPSLCIQKYTLTLLELKDVKGAVAYGTEVSKELKDGPAKAQALNAFAWTMVDPEGPEVEKPDLDFALTAATEASKLLNDEDAAVLDTLGLVLFKKGQVDKAIEIQAKAVEIAKKTALDDVEELEGRLKEFKAAKTDKADKNDK